MTKLSQFKQAAVHVEALRRLRSFRQAYSNEDSPPRRVTISLASDAAPPQQQQYQQNLLATTTGPGPVILSASARSALNKALEHEEATITAELLALGVVIDADLPT